MPINENYKKIGINILKILVFIALSYFIFVYVFKWFLPFIVATIIAYITNPLVTFLDKKLKIPRKVASALTILVFIS